MKELTIKELVEPLQKKIDKTLECFMGCRKKVNEKVLEIEELEKKMMSLVSNLEPVESLIYNQNPQLKQIFESLKRVYGEEENGIDREVSE